MIYSNQLELVVVDNFQILRRCLLIHYHFQMTGTSQVNLNMWSFFQLIYSLLKNHENQIRNRVSVIQRGIKSAFPKIALKWRSQNLVKFFCFKNFGEQLKSYGKSLTFPASLFAFIFWLSIEWLTIWTNKRACCLFTRKIKCTIICSVQSRAIFPWFPRLLSSRCSIKFIEQKNQLRNLSES